MNNLVCIVHKDYRGSTTPTLMCKACCMIYVEAIKKETKVENEPNIYRNRTQTNNGTGS